MKISDNYILKTVAGTAVVVPVGEAAENIHGMIKLNEAAVFIWRMLSDGSERENILSALCEEYKGASRDVLSRDLDAFLAKLKEKNILLSE